MKTPTSMVVLAAVACLSTAVLADDHEAIYVDSSYYICSGGLDRVDELIETVVKPLYDAAVKAGDIKGWGWLSHHTGGKWTRVLYHTSGSVTGAIAAQDKLIDKVMADHADAVEEFGEVCKTHDDYIWKGITGSGGNVLSTDRGEVGLSAYYVCDSREAVADEIVETVFAPVWNANVGKGKLSSWGWAEHIIGGKYRRLATLTAANWDDLFAVRESVIEAAQDSDLAGLFGEICHSHADYMWEIQHESP